MKFLILYKGIYGIALRGPEMRYASLASELVALGHKVVLCGRPGDQSGVPENVEFVSVSKIIRLFLAFISSDVLVIHGGGPLVLFFALIAGLLGKNVILDSYVPHWIELDEIIGKKSNKIQLRLLIKAYFNVARSLFGALIFNGIIVANKRQLDLVRGMMAPFLLTHDFSRIFIVPFGCNELKIAEKKIGRKLMGELKGSEFSDNDFLIGWLGGTYGWFDLESVLSTVSLSIIKNKNIKLVFFGVDSSRQEELLSSVTDSAKGNIYFLPWVDFSTRFDYWAGFDISLVWGGDGYENDYASRTRNFDCLTLGLPIIQNEDDEWGERLEKSGAGRAVDLSSLSELLFELSNDPEKVAQMQQSMSRLSSEFYWSRFANAVVNGVSNNPMSLSRRIFGFVGFFLILPALAVFFLYSLFEMLIRGINK